MQETQDHQLQQSCLGNPMDRGDWRALVHGVAKESDMTEHTRVQRIPFRTIYKHATRKIKAVLCLVTQSCLTLCDPMDGSSPGSSVHGDSLGKNTGVGCHALLQGIFPTQGSNPGLPHCRWILYHLIHQGSPRILEWVAYPFSRGPSQPRNRNRVSCITDRFFTS